MSDPVGWLDEALAALDRDALRREIRTHLSAADPWIEVADGAGVRRLLHLCSNGYLGLATHPKVTAAAADAAHRLGTGTASSRLITGAQTVHRDLEALLADWKGLEAARLLSSGYLANLAVVTALVGPGDTVVSDALNHASIIDACRLSRAQIRVYEHGDAEHAAALLRDAPGRRLLVTDGVFSMDGDLAPLPALCDAAERHGAMVVVDDAHGSGVIGPDGRGTTAALGCTERVHAIVGTLSKALASTGGYVAGSQQLVDWVTNSARPFIFDTAPGAPAVAAAHAAVEVARAEPGLRERAVSSARRLAAGLRERGVATPDPAAAIVPIPVGGNRAALHAMRGLIDRGVLAVAIRPPSVPAGTARLRATVMASHADADIDLAIEAIGAVLAERTGAAGT